jgi:hypothetical protein
MRKAFVTIMPDEPYKTTTSKNITVDCVYTGRRYLLIRLNNDGTMFCLERAEETLEQLENYKLTDEQLAAEKQFQVIMDAEVNTWEAAHLTHDYEHSEVPDPTFTMPSGETWTYHYDDFHGALDQPYYVNDMRYDRSTRTWIRPRYRVHAITKESFWAGLADQTKRYEEAATSSAYLPEQLAKIKEHRDWLKSAPTKYAGVDHWKIPYPVAPPAIN